MRAAPHVWRLGVASALPGLLMMWWWMSGLELQGVEAEIHLASVRYLATWGLGFELLTWPVRAGWPYVVAVLSVGAVLRLLDRRQELLWWFASQGGALLGWMSLQSVVEQVRAPIAAVVLYVAFLSALSILMRALLPRVLGRVGAGLPIPIVFYIFFVVLAAGHWPGTVLASALLGLVAVIQMVGTTVKA